MKGGTAGGVERSRFNTGDSLTTATVVSSAISSSITTTTPQTVSANASLSDDDIDPEDYDIEDERYSPSNSDRFVDE